MLNLPMILLIFFLCFVINDPRTKAKIEGFRNSNTPSKCNKEILREDFTNKMLSSSTKSIDNFKLNLASV